MIAEKLNGDIEVQSEREEGSTFIFTFRTKVKVKAVSAKKNVKKPIKPEPQSNLSVI